MDEESRLCREPSGWAKAVTWVQQPIFGKTARNLM